MPKHTLILSLITASLLSTLSLRGQDDAFAGYQLSDDEWAQYLGWEPLPDVEPKITDKKEIELLQNKLELIQYNSRKAAQELEEVVNESSSATMNFLLGTLYLQNKDYNKAKQYYAVAISKYEDYRRAHKNLGLLYFQERDFKKAITHLSKAAELGDKDGAIFGRMGYCFLQTENYNAAEASYSAAILNQPDNSDWKVGLAQVLLKQGRNAEVISMMDTLIAEKPDDPDLWQFQTNAYVNSGQKERAIVNLEIIKSMGKANRGNLNLLGRIYLQLEMYELALVSFKELLRIDSGSENKDTVIRAADLMTRVQAFDNARELLTSIKQKYTGSLTDEEAIEVLNLDAKIARAQDDEERAAEILTQIIERDRLNGEALLELADYHINRAKDADAEIEEIEGKTMLENEKEELLDDKKNAALTHWEKAIFHLEEAEKLEKFEFNALVKHGQLLVARGKFQDALPKLRNALDIRPDRRIEDYLFSVERAARSR